MAEAPSWPAWATATTDRLTRLEARNLLREAQAFWRDFALAGLTLDDLGAVIEERRRLGPKGRIVVPKTPAIRSGQLASSQTNMAPSGPDHGLFDGFPPLNPDDDRWTHV
mgnify:CR=1 FL=1